MLQGKLSAPATLGGSLQGGVGLQGTLAVGSVYPTYGGATEFTPTESEQTIGTEGKVVLTDLTVDAIPPEYIVPSGNYAISAGGTHDVAAYASASVPSGIVHMKTPSIDKTYGEIRSKATIDAGYHTGGNYTGSALILDKQAGTTITPTESEQVAVAQYRWTTGAVKVAAIPSQYIVPTGEYTISAGGTYDVTEYASASVPSANMGAASSSRTKDGTQLYTTVSWPSFTAGYLASHNPVSTSQILQDETVTPTESAQTVAPTSINHYLESVTVNPIPSQYIVPSGTYTVTSSGTHDVTAYASASVAASTPTNSSESEYITSSGVRKWRYRPKTIVPTAGWAAQHSASNPINGYWQTFDAIPTGTTVTPSTSSQTIGGADTMMEGAVTVAAMPSGTEGTPVATKGTVSGHQVSITPSVTNSAGYISGGTKSGTAVTVSASELVSGTYVVSSSGTKDVINYASASIPAGTAGTPTASKGTVSSHSIAVTPSVTNATGYITGGTKTGTAVTVSASELVSGTKSITANGTGIDVVNYANVDVAVPSATVVQASDGTLSIS